MSSLDEQLLELESSVQQREEIRKQIKEVRDRLWKRGDSVLCTHICEPMLSHAAYFFYAPDHAIWLAFDTLRGLCSIAAAFLCEDTTKVLRSLWQKARRVVERNPMFTLFLIAAVFGFVMRGQALTCWMQKHAFCFTSMTQTMSPLTRFFSISILMMAADDAAAAKKAAERNFELLQRVDFSGW